MNNKGNMLKRMVLSLALVFAVAAVLLAAGTTYAWLSSRVSLPATSYLTGTVNMEVYGTGVEPAGDTWKMDECRDFTWIIENSGSKKAYLRARPVETIQRDETAWGEGTRFVEQGNWGMYYSFIPGKNMSVNLVAGQDVENPAGEVKINETGGNFEVEYAVNGWYIYETHFLIVDSKSLLEKHTTSSGNPVPGQFPFKAEFNSCISSHNFSLPMSGTYPAGALKGKSYDWTGANTLYIAAHASLVNGEKEKASGGGVGVGVMEWELMEGNGCSHWVYHAEDGYWYYCPENPLLLPGEEAMFCLQGCPGETGVYEVQLEVEAIQALPEAAEYLWGLELPCL